MTVQIDIPPFLRGIAGDAKMTNVSGGTVGECLENFITQFPGSKEFLFDKNGKLLKYLDVYVNGKSAYPEELTKKVNNGDKISLLYLIIGG
jgi:molybdopterin converting factor small subunit